MEIRKRRWGLIVGGAVTAVIVVVLAVVGWYYHALTAIDGGDNQPVQVTVAQGDGAQAIADTLQQRGLIRSATAFTVYARLSGATSQFKVGVYTVRKNQDVPAIVTHLISGKSDEKIVLFYPEATLQGNNSRTITASLKKAGFSDQEITEALTAQYQSEVLRQRPEGADLEGYLYPETYHLSADASAKQAITQSLRQFDMVIRQHDLAAKFAARGLNMHQGITLASIVQKESKGCGQATTCDDQRRIAQVFYNRLKADMPLGSDVTYHYAADKAGVPRDHRLQSPYNTRIHKGLPPGPIAAPGLSALLAVADPAETDALYFLSGDDDVTYFARTNEEHEANIRAHCHQKCQLP
ncbi:MAG: endolytic transglycosylase MltG [Candidatus Saccharibacteria bacterium]|nr:endolytic transglycosylase MltG [Candidatus Saccharibacteria bacterium]